MQQWIDLARFTGLQAQKSETSLLSQSQSQTTESANPAELNQTVECVNPAALGCNTTEEAGIDETQSQ